VSNNIVRYALVVERKADFLDVMARRSAGHPDGEVLVVEEVV
jgi:hypothetical protein